MTKKILLAGMLAVGALALGGCAEDAPAGGRGTGSIAPNVALDSSVKAPRQQSRTESRAGTPQANDLSLRLVSADGSFSREWNTLSEFDPQTQFATGDYTLEAWYGDAGKEGFECPYYYGSTPVKIEDSKTTSVALTASLTQAMVSVTYTDAFRNYMKEWSAKVNGIACAASETRPVYVQPGKVSVLVDFTKPNGDKGQNYEVASIQALAKTHYKVLVDLAEGAGDASLVITYDDEVAQQTVEIDISDLVMSASAPEVSAEGFTPGTPVDFVAGMTTGANLKMNVVARGGIGAVTLKTTGASLLAQGWPAEIDLLTATAGQRQILESLGFKCIGLWNNPGLMAVLDFTEVPAHISQVEGDNNTVFSVTVRDRNFKVCEPVELALNLEPLMLEITGSNNYEPGKPLELKVAYNGSDMASNVAFKYFNERATWTTITDVTVSEPVSRAIADYTVTLRGIPASMDQVRVCAFVGQNYRSNEYTAKGAPFEVAVNENDVYARHAFVTVNGTEGQAQADLVRDAAYFISTDGTNFTAANGNAAGMYFDITALEPATEYKVKVSIGGLFSRTVAFTTETPAQLANASMEQWFQDGRTSYPGESASAVWGTNNPMTTSQGANFDYCKISGTVSTDDGHTGKAALLRTIGWGSRNTAVSSDGGKGSTKYVDAGLLHLGSSRSVRPEGYSDREGSLDTGDLGCGVDFGSRPSSLSFWYKYTPKNSADNGLVEFWIKDAGGNVLAEGSRNLAAAGEYTEVTLPMTYTGQGTPKAAKLYVKFLSTNSRTFLEKNNDNLTGPGFMQNKPFLGSQLYVDDITLNY